MTRDLLSSGAFFLGSWTPSWTPALDRAPSSHRSTNDRCKPLYSVLPVEPQHPAAAPIPASSPQPIWSGVPARPKCASPKAGPPSTDPTKLSLAGTDRQFTRAEITDIFNHADW